MAEHRIPNPSVVGSSPTGPVLESKSATDMEKTNESQMGRLAVMALSVVLAVYVGYGIYIGITKPISGSITIGAVVGPIVGLLIAGVGYFYCYINPYTVSRLNETESELRKVVWPKSTPVAATTELWQYTLAVIILMLTLVVYIAIVDTGISYTLEQFIFKK